MSLFGTQKYRLEAKSRRKLKMEFLIQIFNSPIILHARELNRRFWQVGENPYRAFPRFAKVLVIVVGNLKKLIFQKCSIFQLAFKSLIQ